MIEPRTPARRAATPPVGAAGAGLRRVTTARPDRTRRGPATRLRAAWAKGA